MNYLKQMIDIRFSSDPEAAISRISEGVSIRGYNMWLLFCAAVLASIGLDTNSSAVIIGAMLISPLMSPILGVGLSLGIHDRLLLTRSMRNLSAAVILSLIASTLYFSISPLANPTEEIEARTYPTLLDVGVALFGGIAGIVSASRSGLTNAVPGVAIATALMPPLCTAGYGLATGRWGYFAGAFYLFFINAVFISLATFIIVKYLKFPEKEFASRRQRNFYSFFFTVLTIIVTIPSIYFLYTVYEKKVVRNQLDILVLEQFRKNGNEILKWELEDRDSSVWIKIYHTGKALGDSLKQDIDRRLAASGMEEYELKPVRVNMTKEEVNELSAEVSRRMYQQLQLEVVKRDNEKQLRSLPTLAKETKIAFPFIDTLYYGWLNFGDTLNYEGSIPVVFYQSKANLSTIQQTGFYNYLKLRFVRDSVVMIKR